MSVSVKVTAQVGRLMLELPLTRPKSIIRVKHRDSKSYYGVPKATRRNPFEQYDYLEWQIPYAKKTNLKNLLCEGVKVGILCENDLNELEKFIRSLNSRETLEETEKIIKKTLIFRRKIKGGFRRAVENVPFFIKENKMENYFIEVILKERQSGSGTQAMIFLCIYIGAVKDKEGNSLLGRIARKKEFGVFEITSENKEIIKDVVKAFSIASLQHKDDVLNILGEIKISCAR